MRKIINLVALFALSISIFGKDINVGTPITIEIDGSSREEISKAFEKSKLDLDSIEKDNDKYVVKFRSFTPGETTLNIGNKKLIIDTKSVITDKDKEIYPNLSDSSNTKPANIRFPYTMVISGVVAILSIGYLLSLVKFKRNEKILSPDEKYSKRMANINDDNWPFEISLAIREYIDSKLGTHFTNGIYVVSGPITKEDIDFLLFLDNYKFSGEKENIKDESITKVKAIYERLRGEKYDI